MKTVTRADYARAAAALTHWATGDLTGLSTVLDPIENDPDRLTATLLAALELGARRYRDPDSITELRQIAADNLDD